MTHKQRVLKHLKKGKTLTQLKAFKKYGIGHLPDVIRHLRNDGYNISMTLTNGKNRYKNKVNFGVYRLEE